MHIFLLCLVLLYAFAVFKGYPLLRKYEFIGFSEVSTDNPFLRELDEKGDVKPKRLGVELGFREARTVNWIIPGLYDHQRYGSPYSLDIHINSETIQEVSNFRFEFSSDDGQQVIYTPKDGKILLETGPDLDVYSRHFDPFESAQLDWEKIKSATIKLEFVAPVDGQESPIKFSHKYEKKNSSTSVRNPLFSDIFLNI